MPKKRNITDYEAFEKIYQKFYVENIETLFSNLPTGGKVYPGQEQVNGILQTCLDIPCTYRFLYTPSAGLIEPLVDKDTKFPFTDTMHIKRFFEKYVHRSFLIPYWLFAGFAYRLAAQQLTTRSEILNAQYQVEIPLKFIHDNEYAWYLQQNRVLTVDENNNVLTHVNMYTLIRPFATKNFLESSLIQASVLKNEKLNEKFQGLLKQKLGAFFKEEVFNKRQEMLILQYYAGKTTNPLPYADSYRLDLNKTILKKMQEHTGYKFMDIRQVVNYLQEIGSL